ncbi:MAG TPA: ATP-binding protein [Ramlibacter sp.]|nr:ATP-binding protein [Ramlibacter sp.]
MKLNLSLKYVLTITTLVCVVLVGSSALGVYVSTRRSLEQLNLLQQEKAFAAAARIETYMREIVQQTEWASPPLVPPDPDLETLKFGYLKLLRQVPAITAAAWLDPQGLEKLRVSRLEMNRTGSNLDQSERAFFREAAAGRTYYSPVYFRKGTEPGLTIARPSGAPGHGVTVIDVNLKFVWDAITQIQVGRTGSAFVLDESGTLIAHPDISLVLKKTHLADKGDSPRAARLIPLSFPGVDLSMNGLRTQEVLTAHASLSAPPWTVFVEVPLQEALQPLQSSLYQSMAVLLGAIVISVISSVLLARRMARPIRALQSRALAIGSGKLGETIAIRTGDEIEALANQFNTMSARLQQSYALLEQKVVERTAEAVSQRQIAEAANAAKTRFLAAASHDLRQPMHALSLYLGALKRHELPAAAGAVLQQVSQCAEAMDDLLASLLDISRLDAGAVETHLTPLPMAPVLEAIRLEFAPQAAAKGLRLRVRPSSEWACADPEHLQRILRNLVSNAVHHSSKGRVLVACRKMAGRLRVAIYDQGPGISLEHQQLVFEEFYQLGNPARDRAAGLGLGLSIVRRLATLTGASVLLRSEPGRGSMFAIDLPIVAPPPMVPAEPGVLGVGAGLAGALVLAVDDDTAVLHATRELLRQWGCEIVAASSGAQAIAMLGEFRRAPDLLLCDYRLRDGETGVTVIERVRDEFNALIPALIVTGDVVPEDAGALKSERIGILHKPVPDRLLRETMERLLAVLQT